MLCYCGPGKITAYPYSGSIAISGASMAPRPSVKSSLRALSHMVERRRHPRRFIQTDKTPWDEIYRNGIMALRHYSLPPMARIPVGDEEIPVRREKHRIPLILVPALGIHCWTYDLMPNRSMVRYLMARGHDVYLIDWGQPSQADRDLDLDTYVNQWLPQVVERVREHTGSDQVNLLGYCMGGLLCMLYLGSHPGAPVRSLSTIASPVNFHKSGPFGKIFSLAAIPAMQAHDWFQVRLEPLVRAEQRTVRVQRGGSVGRRGARDGRHVRAAHCRQTCATELSSGCRGIRVRIRRWRTADDACSSS